MKFWKEKVVIKCWFIHCVACIEEFPSVTRWLQNIETVKTLFY
jgi:hypothetical protein